MKQGRSLELLTEKLERQLASDANVVIVSPKKIQDIQTGKLREHDVVLTYNQSHHELVIAIECKDRSRPVGVPDIEAFDNKCRYTNINQGVIVSSSGFCKTALDKATSMGIKCLDLKEIDTASFLLPETAVYIHSKRFIEATYTPMVNNSALRVADGYDIFDPENNLITSEIIKNNIGLIQDKLPLGKLGEESTESVYFRAENYYVITHKRKLQHAITGILLTIKYVYEVAESSFTSRRYSVADQDSLIAEIATAPLSIDGEEKEFTIIGKKDGTTYQFIS
ncbi:MAG: restriction endonuclease [Gammaproteobacteria bacterium]|nr:restriction endonuclease [Gammaproteobacteria bacterium]